MSDPNFVEAYSGDVMYQDEDIDDRARADKIYRELYLKPRRSSVITAYDKQREHFEKVAWAALPRFREGQSIRPQDIRKRLSLIRKTGYSVKHYSKLSDAELRAYLKEIRRDIFRNAQDFCPDVVARIVRQNQQQKLESRLIR
ncbi:MAG: hypothetical protein RL557_788 [archaeon]|jgi:hypothetical protein